MMQEVSNFSRLQTIYKPRHAVTHNEELVITFLTDITNYITIHEITYTCH